MARKPRKVGINKNVVKKRELPKYLGKIADDMRKDEEIEVDEMFMELGRAMKALEDSIDERIEDAVIKAFKKLRKEGVI